MPAPNYEPLTISSTAVPLTAAEYLGYNQALVTVETDAVRYRIDGTDPTATEGHLAIVGSVIVLESLDEITNFNAIRVTTDATIRVSYSASRESRRGN